MNYASILKSTDPQAAAGGYKNVFLFCPRSEFMTIARPGVAAAIGDTIKIVTAHTFAAADGFHTYDCKQNSVTLTGTSVGDDGAKEMEFTSTFVLLGDSASTDEQLRRLLNDDVICLIKEAACLVNDSYIQLGDECVSPTFSVAFDGKTTKEGMKEYTVTVVCKKKFFYIGAVTMKP